jgi:putative ABC transport system permease protein
VSLLVGAFSLGFILSLLALGVYMSFRVFGYADLTAEGSITLGGAVAAVLLLGGWPPWIATLAACLAGALAGAFTGLLITWFQVTRLLAGILTMTALYSINLRIMDKSVIPLANENSLVAQAERVGLRLFGAASVRVAGWEVTVRDLCLLLLMAGLVVVVAVALLAFLRTNLGAALRATGENPQMMRALGSDDRLMLTLGLALSNGLVGLAGALLAQYQGFADVQMGIGMLAWGLASVIIGEALVGPAQLGYALTGAIMGSILFRLMVALALRWGLNPNDLKLITAAIVLAAFLLPKALESLRENRRSAARA